MIGDLTADQAAAASGRHPDTIRRALADGTLHGKQRTRKGRWLIEPACLAAWEAGQLCSHRAEKSNVVPIGSRAAS
ncbi:helix-turn-helix domain-containing protein [Cellulomonas palmilytica]|uniref:helix-turn-helix domain-containing protein n=1 Tax=Cellulomonas palmilytica TaxID=2608402 RepID=UPI001F3A6F41|nr:helix-turn-helix domain-containing protein [Cellulomonas palmilytica]UJP39362.1 hypothetical protein F1D97_13605 [Cellulomonas palmilytica]